jgi:molybdopterin-containing oxidoreductase family iron-sulfur binding subunit
MSPVTRSGAPADEFDALRARLEGTRGREYWRSLEALSETPEFRTYLHREFPENASEWLDPVGRRGFLKLMGASLALAGVSACTRQPVEHVVPYVQQPEDLVPGKPLFFATAMPVAGAGTGVGLLVESHMGRPTKIEGNPDHPMSQGATDLYAQAAILGLYDPDRSQTIIELGEVRTFGDFTTTMAAALAAQEASQGAGLRILTETVASPTLAAQIEAVLARFPSARWVQWDSAGRHNVRAGSRMAFGEYVDAQYAIDAADVILALDADFMCAGPAGLRHARAFAARRRVEGEEADLNRLYAVESTPTNTGTRADHRLPLKPSEVEAFARAIAQRLGVPGAGAGNVPPGAAGWVDAVVADLQANRGRGLVLAGDTLSPAVHALVHAINDTLGNVGATLTYTAPAEARPADAVADLRALVDDMSGGRVDLLLVLGGNPVYTAPADLDFAGAMDAVALRVHLGHYEDETAARSHWHLPEAHFLETWGDVRAADGTVTIMQPLIAPLYSGRSVLEVVAALGEGGGRPAYDLLREHWAAQTGLSTERPAPAAPPVPVTEPAAPAVAEGEVVEAAAAPDEPPVTAAPVPLPSPFDREWRRWVHDGVVPDTAFPARAVVLQPNFANAVAPAGVPAEGLEIAFRPDATVFDGRFANNAWLQELPKALTRLTWDNPALIAPATAARLGLENGDAVTLTRGERAVRLPVWILPGQPADTLTLSLGYGRTRAGGTANGIGWNVNPLRTADALDAAAGVELAAAGDSVELASTQDHWSLEGRALVRVATTAEFAANPQFAREMGEEAPAALTLYDAREFTGYQWGMSIDQGVCTGCNACVVACQAENNVPVVGKAQVLVGREMHWLRVDRYFSGSLDNPDTYHQPMPCQQCENAPCEVVCPVAATTHSEEGLNEMTYNRCVGTRYCSNNCPYKVRRFNFLLYQDWETESFAAMRNPDVSVRSRGVMEKCTYCVQRINHARVEAKLENREIRDGDVRTACQAACPTDAIVFGNINDAGSRVTARKASPLNYSLLAELNNRPRTTYLAIVRNPNAALETGAAGAENAD